MFCMKKIVYLLVLFIGLCNFALADGISEAPISQISKLQKVRSLPKMYVPNFVLLGDDAIFKVVAKPKTLVRLTVDYGANIPVQKLERETNENGIVAFHVKIIQDESFVGKSVEVEAVVIESENEIRAVIQNENGTIKNTNRIYIADNESDKGVLFAPWQALNTLRMNYEYDERSGYDPLSEQVYTNNTPVYIRNMRDAQDNVREIPTNSGNSNR